MTFTETYLLLLLHNQLQSIYVFIKVRLIQINSCNLFIDTHHSWIIHIYVHV